MQDRQKNTASGKCRQRVSGNGVAVAGCDVPIFVAECRSLDLTALLVGGLVQFLSCTVLYAAIHRYDGGTCCGDE